ATMGLAWNIISGYAGQTSFGHQAFFGIGAYVTVLLVVTAGLTPWIGMAAGMAAAVIAAVLIGLPTFRLAGIYFALATLAYPLIFRIVMELLGYQEVPIPMMRDRPAAYMQFRDPRAYDLLALAALGRTLLLSHWIEGSRLGYALRALRANEEAAEAAGVDTFRAKMVAYTLSAAPAAVIGAIYAHAILFVVTPDAVFGVLVIVQTLVVCLVGGVGSKWGPVIGSGIMVPMSEMLDATVGDQLPGIQGVVYGAALLEVQGVSRAFLGLCALDDVSFSVRAGEILGVIGPNGAGKTKLFNVLNGFLLPDAGQVRYRGTPIHGLRPSAICRRGIGRTFQVVRTFPQLTVLDNVMVGAFAHETSPPRARERARAAMAAVGLGRADDVPGALTTLDLRLMELARCLASAPDLILLDE